MKTEEGKLKDRVKLWLKQRQAYFFMPVQTGYGAQTVDFLCCVPQWHNGGRIARFVGIETKAPGKKPTPRQELCLKQIAEAGGVAFYCDSYEGFVLSMAAHGFPDSEGK